MLLDSWLDIIRGIVVAVVLVCTLGMLDSLPFLVGRYQLVTGVLVTVSQLSFINKSVDPNLRT